MVIITYEPLRCRLAFAALDVPEHLELLLGNRAGAGARFAAPSPMLTVNSFPQPRCAAVRTARFLTEAARGALEDAACAAPVGDESGPAVSATAVAGTASTNAPAPA
jgi:hypothetical protein